MKSLLIVALCFSLSGCLMYTGWRKMAAEQDIREEQAQILRLYRECLQQFRGKPDQAKAQCEHYTQSLYSVDVRGMR